jgi:TolB protein
LLSALFGWDNGAPIWSPDGRKIAFLVGRIGQRRVHRYLYVMRPNGTGKRRLTPGFMVAGRQGDPATWSPDGSQIGFSALAPSRTGIWAVRPTGRSLRLVVKRGFEPAWSPDGRWIAYRTITHL